ncbi:MAG: PHP domain-containing protein [Halapricum sp.]
MYDYHAHSNYSDGRFLVEMLVAAQRQGLEGIGFADHCNVSADPSQRQFAREFGFNLDLTHERRRDAIESLRERYDLTIFDAVEMDYHPDDEAAIAEFLETAGFEYAIGSVHTVDGRNLHDEAYFGAKSRTERRVVVETYVDRVVSLIDSELFAIAGHVDLPQRNETLRGLFTDEHYRRIASALEASRTVPELNAGRVTDDYGQFHPGPDFREILAEHDVGFTLGTDAHTPESVRENADELAAFVDRWDIDPVTVHE